MEISISPVTRGVEFTRNVLVTTTGDEIVTSILVEFEDEPDIGVSIDGSTISGNYISTFFDEVSYVSKGSSDRIEDPTEIIGFGNLPPNKDAFSFRQDLRQFVNKLYKVTVTYTSILSGPGTVVQIVPHQVNNNWSFGGIFIKNYYGL